MTGRFPLVLLPLLGMLVGCVEDSRRLLVTDPPLTPTQAKPDHLVQRAPATEETAKKVIAVGQKIILANPQIGFRPIFATVGAPHLEIFHRGGKTEGYQIFISEGLVKRCASEEQLAAVLCIELGKMISEREATLGSGLALDRRRLPPQERIGTDSAGTFGPADGTRMMELARAEQDQKARRRSTPPKPTALAKGYLVRASYDPAIVNQVADLLREAEKNYAVEKQVRDGLPLQGK